MPSTPHSAAGSLSDTAGLMVDVLASEPHKRLRLHGELDLATAPLLVSILDQHAMGSETLALDLSDLSFCDLVGLTTLERAQQRLRRRGCRMTVQGIPGQLRRLLAVDGVNSTLAFNRKSASERVPVASSASN